jgi:hypothetical protein
MENKRTGIIVGIGAGCLLLCLVAVIGGGFLVLKVTESPDGINVDLDVPSEVRINDNFTIEVTVHNTLQKSRVLTDIDIDATYIQGVFINEAFPAFYDSWDGDDFRTYSFDIDIAPNESTTVQLDATALQSGTFTGMLDVCIDTVYTCLEYPILTRVTQQ